MSSEKYENKAENSAVVKKKKNNPRRGQSFSSLTSV